MNWALEHWESLVGIAVGLAGLLIAWRSQRSQILRHTISSNNLIRERRAELPALSITYEDEPVETLTVSRIALWNAGTEVVTRDSFAAADELRIEAANGASILDASVIRANHKVDQLTCVREPSGHTVAIDFDFLGRRHGGVIQVIHTGTGSDDLAVRGTLKNGRSICSGADVLMSNRARKRATVNASVGLVLGIVLLLSVCRLMHAHSRLLAFLCDMEQQNGLRELHSLYSAGRPARLSVVIDDRRWTYDLGGHNSQKEEFLARRLREAYASRHLVNIGMGQSGVVTYNAIGLRGSEGDVTTMLIDLLIIASALTLLSYAVLLSGAWCLGSMPPRQLLTAAVPDRSFGI